MHFKQFLLEQGLRYGSKQAILVKDKSISYEELTQSAELHAYVFHELGIKPQETLLIMCENHLEHILTWFGLMYLGAIAVPINIHLRGEGLAYIVNHSNARFAVVDEMYAPYLEHASPGLQLIVVGQTQQHKQYETMFHINQAPSFSTSDFPANWCASILYTSGTLGLPKGVMLSHHAYMNQARYYQQMISSTPEDRLFTTLPLFHINAQATTLLGGLYSGATIIIASKFSASQFFEEVSKAKATVFNSLASMLPILLKQPPSERDRQHSVRATICAATPKEVWLQFEARFGIRIIEGYGLTETAGFCMVNPLDSGKIGSIGKPLDFVEVMVADVNGDPLSPAVKGEICIRAAFDDTIMSGYYKDSERTNEAVVEGWFHSGDRGYMDEDGFFYFSDRIKHCIRRRGENISLWDVEKVINQHPKVLESCAIGVPSEVGEDDLKIVVVRQDETLTPVELLDFCQGKMAYFMIPRYVEFHDELPKTATERVQKFKLQEEGVGKAWDREKVNYNIRRD